MASLAVPADCPRAWVNRGKSVDVAGEPFTALIEANDCPFFVPFPRRVRCDDISHPDSPDPWPRLASEMGSPAGSADISLSGEIVDIWPNPHPTRRYSRRFGDSLSAIISRKGGGPMVTSTDFPRSWRYRGHSADVAGDPFLLPNRC